MTALAADAGRREAQVSVVWRNVRVQEFKLERLKEVVEKKTDWEAVDEAINLVLFSEEMSQALGESDEADDEYDTELPWDA